MNPLNNPVSSPNAGTQPTKAVNRETVYVPRTHNTFDMSYFHFLTQRYGFYHPFYVEDGIPRDMLPLSNSHDVASLPMKSQFKSVINMNKDYFFVANEAIQPKTWQYIYPEPGQGDDVPDDVQNIMPSIYQFINSLKLIFTRDSGQSDSSRFVALLNMEMFLSTGSILFNLGWKLTPYIVDQDGKYYSFDKVFDLVTADISGTVVVRTDDFVSTFVIGGDDDFLPSPTSPTVSVTPYEFISIVRRYGSDCQILDFSFNGVKPTEFGLLFNMSYSGFRMDRVNAYQLACSQFYVNPKVDFIYNAQMYQDNFLTLLRSFCEDYDYPFEIGSFLRNGIGVFYDAFSQYYYRMMLSSFIYVIDNTDDDLTRRLLRIYDLVNYLFGHRESLRFGDYFTDSRTQRLAGAAEDQTIRVVGDEVNVIDLAEKIIVERFNNVVVKLGNDQDKYLSEVMGAELTPDYHIPKFIVHTENAINANEVSNTTSVGQGLKVTNLDSQDDRFAYQIDISRPGIVVGISYFSVPRVYCQTKDRSFFHVDRADFANPMLQHLGDQAIYSTELSDRVNGGNNDVAFGWQSRYEEYKQRFSVASGAFVELLSSWANVSDSVFGPVRNFVIPSHQSPDYIRVVDFEFNKFFDRMQGNSLANGFHFIVRYNNKVVANRNLEINPNTL